MTDPNSRTGATITALRAIPPEKFAVKAKRTIIGVGFAGLGGWLIRIGATRDEVSLWLVGGGAGLILLGATVWSGELVLLPVKLLGAVLIDLWQKAKGTTPGGSA